MKTLLRTGLFFLLVIFVLGCRTQRLSTAAEYSKFYNSINKEYDDAVAFTQSGLNIQQKEKESKNKGKGATSEKDSLYIHMTEMSKDIRDLKAITAELKKNEKADFDKVNTSAVTSALPSASQSVNSPVVALVSPETEIVSTSTPPAFPVNKIENSEKTGFKREKEEEEVKNIIRKGKFTLVNSDDASLLKKYNVVIATLSKEAGTDFLKDAIKKNDPNEVVFAVKNSAGKYYVILGSYDTQTEALEKRRNIIKNYTQRYSKAALMKKYGIQFSDTWIIYDEN